VDVAGNDRSRRNDGFGIDDRSLSEMLGKHVFS